MFLSGLVWTKASMRLTGSGTALIRGHVIPIKTTYHISLVLATNKMGMDRLMCCKVFAKNDQTTEPEKFLMHIG